jgi:DNA-directed RNA polymerase subunit RPC12/RpoP
MSIRVIGKDLKIVKNATCYNCAALLEFAPSDIRERRESCMGDIDTKRYINCPDCNTEVRVSS